jgi:hypothetical protein
LSTIKSSRVGSHVGYHRPADNNGEKNNQLEMGACDKKGEGSKAMAMGIRVAGDKEGKGDDTGDGVGDEGGVPQRE